MMRRTSAVEQCTNLAVEYLGGADVEIADYP
jgi:hypothetical protein